MKICILRRDGGNIHNGMAMVIPMILNKFFGEMEIRIQKDRRDEFTQMLTFIVPSDLESKIVPFIQDVSKFNPLYAVRIIDDEWQPIE